MKTTSRKMMAGVLAAGALAISFPAFPFSLCGDLSLPDIPDTFAPAAPVPVSAVASRCHAVTLTWNGSYDTHTLLKTYRLYRSGILLAETHGTPQFLRAKSREFTFTGLADDTAFTFAVSAVDIKGNESVARPFPTVTTLPADHLFCTDITPPTAPSGFSVTRLPGFCRNVTTALATQATDDQSGLDHYDMYRDGRKIDVTTNGNTFSERFGLTPGRTYAYSLRAVDKAGNESAPSNVVQYTVPECATVVPAGNIRTLVLAINLPGVPLPTVTMPAIEQLAFGIEMSNQPVAKTAALFPFPFPPLNPPHMRGFFLENTYNRIHLVRAAQTGVVGWIQLAGSFSTYCQTSPGGGGVGCNTNKIKTDALQLAVANFGWDPATPVDRFVLVVNGQLENNAGTNQVMLSSFNLGTAIHEMAHTFGVEHAASWMGRDFGSPVGATNALPADFNDLPFGAFDLSEYGDPFNRMGAPLINHLSTFQKELMGALPPSQVGHAIQDGSYTLDQVELPSAGIKELRLPIRRNGGTLKAPFVIAEYRTGRGYDAAAPQGGQTFRGIQLRLVPDRFFGAGSDVMFLGTLTAQEPVFIDWHRGVKYTLVSSNDSQAVLNICGLGIVIVSP
jgi:chitodextrinase